MYRIINSVVKHNNVIPFVNPTEYVEGNNNKAIGYIQAIPNKSGVWYVRFTNSHGNPAAYAGGSCYRVGNFVFAKGLAYGYEGYPNGRPVISIAKFSSKRNKMRMWVPSSLSQYLSIDVDYLPTKEIV